MEEFKIYQASGYLTKLVTDASDVRIMYDEISGSLVEFDTPISAPLAELIVDINPVQDLHGQDAPYPAGGGKNLCYIEDFSDTIHSVNISATNNVLTLNGTADGTIAANSAEWKRIKFKITTEGRYAISFYPSLPAGLGYYIYDSSMSTVPLYQNVPVGDYTIGLYIPSGTSLNTTIQFQIEAGTTATSFAPYSNICPITGWTGANIYHCGEDTSNPTVYTVSWQDEEGTVYGGTVDLVSGELVVDRAEVDLGTLTWFYNPAVKLFFTKLGTSQPNYNYRGVCSKYSVANSNPPEDKSWASSSYIGSGYNVIIHDSAYSDTSIFRTSLSGVQLVYELATPITYQLTPQEISTLVGVNNIWADTGDVSVKYRTH